MKTPVLSIALMCLASRIGAAGPTAVGSPLDSVTPASRVWLTGSSNVSKFSCRTSGVTGTVDLQANATRRSILSGQNISNAPSLRIPVGLLDCGVSAMNRDLREALRADEFDAIEFHLDSYDVTAGSPRTARIAGRLRIAGTERAIVATAAIDADTSGTLHIRGAHVVQMTDFGVEPPRRFAGLVRVRDSIVVHFDIVPATEWRSRWR
jgi:polyisoprenoid-binding protein YceI